MATKWYVPKDLRFCNHVFRIDDTVTAPLRAQMMVPTLYSENLHNTRRHETKNGFRR